VGKDTTIAVDLAKSVFEIAVSDRPGRIAERQRLSRRALLPFFARRPPATVLLEACGTAHFWAREMEGFGHRVRLLPAQHVRRYRAGNKTDRADAKALLEAFRNEEIRPVPIKSPAQQELTALHRLRAAWHGTRTARINTLRGLLREQGIALPAGASAFVAKALELAGDAENGLGDALRFAAFELVLEIRELERRIVEVERRLEAIGRQNPLVRRLRSVPGIGLLSSTALAGFVGDLRRFPSGRHFASYLGLTPRERSTGGIRRLGAITKRDNKATVALANKLARYAWAVATRETLFELKTKAA
jgi:transposase